MGSSPFLKLVKDVSRMNAKTTPLAPQSATFAKRMSFTIAVTTAVIPITAGTGVIEGVPEMDGESFGVFMRS